MDEKYSYELTLSSFFDNTLSAKKGSPTPRRIQPAIPIPLQDAIHSFGKSLKKQRHLLQEGLFVQTETVSPPSRWSPQERLLYEDVIALLSRDDSLGAMISMERLFILRPDAIEMTAFLQKNSRLLLDLYAQEFAGYEGSLQQTRQDIAYPSAGAIQDELLELVDGTRTIPQILSQTSFDSLKVSILLGHFLRIKKLFFA